VGIRRFRRAERACLEEVLRTHKLLIWKVVRRYAEDYDDFWDLTQMVAIRVCEGCGSFRGQASLESWLYRVAANTCRDEIRRRSAERRRMHQVAEWGVLEDSHWAAPPSSSSVFSQEVEALARKALPQLPAREREAFQLCILKGKAYEDAASVMGVEISTVRSLVRKARARLRVTLQEVVDDLS
jgi:RNA polymerase sigma-70 factor, ECF subfamily